MEMNRSLTVPAVVLRGHPEHVTDVIRLSGSSKGDGQPGADVAPCLKTQHGVLHVIHRAETIPIDIVPGSGYPHQIGAKHTASSKRLCHGK